MGNVSLWRRYDECLPCRLPEHVVDERVGLGGRYTVGLRRLAVRAGADWAFQKASENLDEFCGLKLSHETVRELCQQEAPKMAAWHRDSAEVCETFIQAQGDIEFLTDGTCVNTTEGWKEVKSALFSKRRRGKGVLPDQWEDRELPRLEATIVFAGVGDNGFAA